MNRQQAEKLLAAFIFDELDEPTKTELLAYLETDAELREQLADMRLTVKLLQDSATHEPPIALDDNRREALLAATKPKPGKAARKQRKARSGRPSISVLFTIRHIGAAAALILVGVGLVGMILPALQRKSRGAAGELMSFVSIYSEDQDEAASDDWNPGEATDIAMDDADGDGRADERVLYETKPNRTGRIEIGAGVTHDAGTFGRGQTDERWKDAPGDEIRGRIYVNAARIVDLNGTLDGSESMDRSSLSDIGPQHDEAITMSGGPSSPDFSGPQAPVLGDVPVVGSAFKKDADKQAVNTPRITFRNGSTAYTDVAKQQHFVSDLEPVGSGDAVAFDPQITVPTGERGPIGDDNGRQSGRNMTFGDRRVAHGFFDAPAGDKSKAGGSAPNDLYHGEAAQFDRKLDVAKDMDRPESGEQMWYGNGTRATTETTADDRALGRDWGGADGKGYAQAGGAPSGGVNITDGDTIVLGGTVIVDGTARSSTFSTSGGAGAGGGGGGGDRAAGSGGRSFDDYARKMPGGTEGLTRSVNGLDTFGTYDYAIVNRSAAPANKPAEVAAGRPATESYESGLAGKFGYEAKKAAEAEPTGRTARGRFNAPGGPTSNESGAFTPTQSAPPAPNSTLALTPPATREPAPTASPERSKAEATAPGVDLDVGGTISRDRRRVTVAGQSALEDSVANERTGVSSGYATFSDTPAATIPQPATGVDVSRPQPKPLPQQQYAMEAMEQAREEVAMEPEGYKREARRALKAGDWHEADHYLARAREVAGIPEPKREGEALAQVMQKRLETAERLEPVQVGPNYRRDLTVLQKQVDLQRRLGGEQMQMEQAQAAERMATVDRLQERIEYEEEVREAPIRQGQKLAISMYDAEKPSDEKAWELQVANDGRVVVPDVGVIDASGLTPTELSQRIAHELGTKNAKHRGVAIVAAPDEAANQQQQAQEQVAADDLMAYPADFPQTTMRRPGHAENEKSSGDTSVQTHDIRDLIVGIPAFTDAPEFNLDQIASDSDGGGNIFADEGPAGAENLYPRDVMTMRIADLIRNTIDPDGWRATGGLNNSIEELNGTMVINTTPENQRRIAELLTELRKAKGLPVKPVKLSEAKADRRTREQMLQPIPVDFDANQFQNVVEYLRNVTGANIVVDWKALESLNIRRDEPVTIQLSNVSADKALRLILDQVGGEEVALGYHVDEGVIRISTKEVLSEKTIPRAVDINDLIAASGGDASKEVEQYQKLAEQSLAQLEQGNTDQAAKALARAKTFLAESREKVGDPTTLLRMQNVADALASRIEAANQQRLLAERAAKLGEKVDPCASAEAKRYAQSVVLLGEARQLADAGKFDEAAALAAKSAHVMSLPPDVIDPQFVAQYQKAQQAHAEWSRAAEAAKAAEEADNDLPSASQFAFFPVNPWVMTAQDKLSTFGLDVDTASYTLCRRYIRAGYRPPRNAVRMEEFVNAFDYNYPQQQKGVFGVYVEGAPSPFAKPGSRTALLKIGIRGKVIGREGRKPAHLVFVVDASGSMARGDRLPLVQYALTLLTNELEEGDRVSLVTYGTKSRLILEAVPAASRQRITSAISQMQAGGTTNMVEGLELGYAMARKVFKAGETARVILCSDGVANVGAMDADAILKKVEDHRKQGITFTAAGFGFGAYNDALLERLADHGDGSYVFIDSQAEAQRVFVEKMSATLQTIAKDAKIQVEFNPNRVRRYRLIGYENRAIADEKFRDDTVDAGEVGSGQSATALYEVELEGEASPESFADLGTVFVRYRNMETEAVEEVSHRISSTIVKQREVKDNPRFYMAASAAFTAELLRGSEHVPQDKGNFKRVERVMEKVTEALPLDNTARELLWMTRRAPDLPMAP